MLQIYNSLTKKKEPFTPLVPGEIKLYVCGMTVYDLCHIGHARMMVVFDAFVRFLRQSGYQVTFVRNITDVDDKIIHRAHENKETLSALTSRTIQAMHEDEAALGCLRPDLEPKATGYIEKMVTFIEALIEKGVAYVAEEGDVYYSIQQFPEYGQLSHRQTQDMRAGARVEVDHNKRDPLDFVLWKLSKAGEPSWPSPWGEGRPGWHIECSTMASDVLGKHFDIHGGGIDLKFPHHENEIAQSQARYGCQYVNYWMHSGHVQVENEKMSKSLGNFLTIRAALEQYHPEVVRYFLLSTHYRSPVNFSDQNIQQAEGALTRFYTALRGIEPTKSQRIYQSRFMAALNDDFNVPQALSVLFECVTDINRCRDKGDTKATELAAELMELGAVLGLLQASPEAFLKEGVVMEEAADIESLIQQRTEARQAKNWALADDIREQLDKMGVSIEDTAQGTTWRKT